MCSAVFWCVTGGWTTLTTGRYLVWMRKLCYVAMSQGQGKCCYRTVDTNKGVAVAQLLAELRLTKLVQLATTGLLYVESSWNVMAHGDAREGKWKGNWRMEWVASTLYTTSEHGVSTITTTDAHTSAASSRMSWRPRRFKWTRPFRRKTKSGFCACAITFQKQSTTQWWGLSAAGTWGGSTTDRVL